MKNYEVLDITKWQGCLFSKLSSAGMAICNPPKKKTNSSTVVIQSKHRTVKNTKICKRENTSRL